MACVGDEIGAHLGEPIALRVVVHDDEKRREPGPSRLYRADPDVEATFHR